MLDKMPSIKRRNDGTLHIVLFQPEIPPNTGNIIRLAANTGCHLHLIEPLGFSMDDRHLKRAGLDYHEYVDIRRHQNWEQFLELEQPAPDRLFALSSQGKKSLFRTSFRKGDWFVFGQETRGLPPSIQTQFGSDQLLRLPMFPNQRSLNLSNAVAVSVFEVWRQIHFTGAESSRE